MAASVLLLVLTLSAISFSSGNVFESIDCGSDGSYVDVNGIKWKGDSDLIKNGEAKMVQRVNSISTVMDTLRVFSSRKKNCYNISVTNVSDTKGRKILVRAGFFYGNYDLKSFPPTFELHFDGNYWATVTTSIEEWTSHEIIYVPQRDVASICVAQTKPNQLPFISTLEVRSLGPLAYNRVGRDIALFRVTRIGYGTDTIVRFPDDRYDRIWTTVTDPSGYTKLVNEAMLIDLFNTRDIPPRPVVISALTTTAARTIVLTPIVNVASRVYMNFYFSEVTELTSSQTRSFTINKDGASLTHAIMPTFGTPQEYAFVNMVVSPSTVISLVATSDSTLPPLINAAEVFTMGASFTDATDSNDVEGLTALQYSASGFEVLQEWRSDPCLPLPYSWEWISCTSDVIPRVTALNLRSFGLKGPLPDFSSMNALETIDLSNNSLSGDIPAFLGKLPRLKELNLAHNKFSGVVPASLKENTKLKLVLTGNPYLCGLDKPCGASGNGTSSQVDSLGHKKKSKNIVLIVVVIGCLALAFILVVVYILCFKNKSPSAGGGAPGQSVGGSIVPDGVWPGTSTSPGRMPEQSTGQQMMGKGEEKTTNQYANTAGELVTVEVTYPVDQQASHGVHNAPSKAVVIS